MDFVRKAFTDIIQQDEVDVSKMPHISEHELTQYLRHKLSAGERERVANHMLICSFCPNKLAKLIKMELRRSNTKTTTHSVTTIDAREAWDSTSAVELLRSRLKADGLEEEDLMFYGTDGEDLWKWKYEESEFILTDSLESAFQEADMNDSVAILIFAEDDEGHHTVMIRVYLLENYE